MIVTGENIYVLKHLLDKSDFETSVSHSFGNAKKKWIKFKKGKTMRKWPFLHFFFVFRFGLNQMLFETVAFCRIHFRWFHWVEERRMCTHRNKNDEELSPKLKWK